MSNSESDQGKLQLPSCPGKDTTREERDGNLLTGAYAALTFFTTVTWYNVAALTALYVLSDALQFLY